jgi:hypothetical protein
LTLTDSGPTHEPARVTDWLRPQRIFAGSGRVAAMLVLLTAIAYHVAWAVSGRPYVSADLIVLSSALAVVVVVALLARVKGGLVTIRGAVYYFQSLVGIAGVTLGLTMVVYGNEPGLGLGRTGMVGTMVLVGGVLTFAAGVFLRPARPALSRRVPQDFATQKLVLSDGDAIVRRSRGDFGAGRIERLVDLCTNHVKNDDLHYVAYYVDGRCAFYVDVFDHHAIESYFTEVTQDRRREEYLRLAIHLNEWLPGMNHSFDGIDSGVLIRVVLDVERGAFYYYKVDSRRFVIGVTLDQSVVHKADSVMTKLAREVQVLLGHRTNPDFND